MKAIISRYSIIFLLLGMSACNEAPKQELRQAVIEAFKQDRVALNSVSKDLLGLLAKKRYDELDEYLVSLQKNYEQGANEWAVLKSFLLFNTKDERYSEYFNNWVLHNNGSWTGRLARGLHYVAVAWEKRGTKYIQDTPQASIENMEYYFSLAEKDIYAALKDVPRAIAGYKMLLQINMAAGSNKDRKDILSKALQVAPESYFLRWEYITGLQPKWGGSIWAIRSFANSAQEWREKNPRIYALLGYEYSAEADQAERNKDYEKAAALYTQALKYAPVGSWLRDRARCFRKLGRVTEEIRDLNKLLVISPDDTKLLADRGYAYIQKGHYESAIVDFEHALKLDPELDYVSNNLGWIYHKQGDNARAIGYFEMTLEHDPDNVFALNHCGFINAHLDNFEKAEACLLHALKIAPEDADVWRNYADVLYMKKDPGHIDAMKTYLKYADPEEQKELYNNVRRYLEENRQL